MFNLSLDTSEPEQTFYFCGNPSFNRGFSSNPELLEAVSFCFANQSEKEPNKIENWNAMTLYCLLKSGDVVSISPILPFTCSCDYVKLHTLNDLAFKDGKIDDNQHYWNLKWLRGSKAPISLKKQGPYLTVPSDNEFTSKMDSYTYSDIFVIDGDLFPIVLVVSSGGVFTFMLCEPPMNNWADSVDFYNDRN
jgi:hypothetical protein